MTATGGTAELQIKLSEREGSLFTTIQRWREGSLFTTGGRRWVAFRGSLWRSQSRLEGAAFELQLLERDPQEPGAPEAAIGKVELTPHAQPSEFTQAQQPPFHAIVCLARSDFDAALNLVDVTFGEDQLAAAHLTVQSDQFPPPANDFDHPFRDLDRIDLSAGFQGSFASSSSA